MQYKYKVKQDDEGNPLVPNGTTVPNIGIVVDGHIESSTEFENPNFERLGETSHLNGVVPQSQQSANTDAESEQV